MYGNNNSRAGHRSVLSDSDDSYEGDPAEHDDVDGGGGGGDAGADEADPDAERDTGESDSGVGAYIRLDQVATLQQLRDAIAQDVRAQLVGDRMIERIVNDIIRLGAYDHDLGLALPPPEERDASLARAVAASRAEIERNRAVEEAARAQERKLRAIEMRHAEEMRHMREEFERLRRNERAARPLPIAPESSGPLTRAKRARLAGEPQQQQPPPGASPAASAPQPPTQAGLCCVCLETLESMRGCVYPCRHAVYHYECAMQLFEHTGNCAFHSPPLAIERVEKVYA